MTEDELKEISRRGEQTREDILAAAHKLFINQGFHGTSMRQIASAAGIALGGLYNHFNSKEDVFHAVFFQYHPYRDVLPVIATIDATNTEDFIRSAFGRIVEVMDARPDFLNLMFIEIVEFGGKNVSELFTVITPQVGHILEGLYQENAGKLRTFRPIFLIRALIGLFLSYYITDKVFGPYAPAEFRENAAEQYVDIFLHGIMNSTDSGTQEQQ